MQASRGQNYDTLFANQCSFTEYNNKVQKVIRKNVL